MDPDVVPDVSIRTLHEKYPIEGNAS
jgi:hypothetical protein